MSDYTKDFALAPGHVWLNAASEGPLPKVAAEALQEALSWKMSPHLLTIPKFFQVPLDLKKTLAALIRVRPEDIILGNSTTYGLHLLANGLPLKSGDEVIVMRNDFPSDVLPWLHLKERGVEVRQIQGQGLVLSPEDVLQAITPATRVVCLPSIHSFSGLPLDLVEIGQICRRYGILFIANMSQSVGAFETDVGKMPVDAVVCAGYKWLLGPYATGFCWMSEEVRHKLTYPQAYWAALMDASSLNSTGEIQLPQTRSSARYDVFAAANFFNTVPWKASVEYVMKIGVAEVSRHNAGLVRRFIDGLDGGRYRCLVPKDIAGRSSIVVFSCLDPQRNSRVHAFLNSQGVHTAFWKGNVRVSPHIYNREEDIDNLLSVLRRYKDE